MNRDQPPQWGLTSDKPYFLHLALFVRDVLQLEVGSSGRYPPQLRASVPDLTPFLSSAMRVAADSQWGSWWELTLEHSVRYALSDEITERDSAVRGFVAAKDHFLDEVIANTTESQGDVFERLQLVIAEGSRWFYGTDNSQEETDHFAPIVDGMLVSSIASEVLETIVLGDHAIAVGIFQLDVVGSWFQIHGAGVLLASNEFLMNERLLRPALRDLFHLSATNNRVQRSMTLGLSNYARPVPWWSSLETPIEIAVVGEGKLILKEVSHYQRDGFELCLSLVGDSLPIEIKDLLGSLDSSRPGPGRPGMPGVFVGFDLEVAFADMRTTGRVEAPLFSAKHGYLISSRFWRVPVDPLDLWLWI